MPYELIFAAGGVFGMGLALGLAWKGRQLHREVIMRSAAEADVRRLNSVEGLYREKESQLSRAQRELARLRAERESESKIHREKLAVLEEARTRLADTFKSLSADIFVENSRQFLDLASMRMDRYQRNLENNMKSQRQEVTHILSPIGDSLKQFGQQVKQLEKARQTTHDTLMKQTQSMLEMNKRIGEEASNLAQAMESKTPIGRWGEMHLRRTVELTDMMAYCDFYPAEAEPGSSSCTPDLVIRLPGGKQVAVDAKVPMRAYRSALREKNEKKRKKLMAEHSAQVRQHIAVLSRQSYWKSLNPSTVFVVLFLPGEAFYMDTLREDSQLMASGAEQRVLLAGPSAFIAMLHTAAFSWSEQNVMENAGQIRDLGVSLYQQLTSMAGHWTAVGRSLRNLVGNYNDTVATMENRVMSTARGFQDLIPNEQTEVDLEPPPRIQVTPKTPKIGNAPIWQASHDSRSSLTGLKSGNGHDKSSPDKKN